MIAFIDQEACEKVEEIEAKVSPISWVLHNEAFIK